MSWDTNMRVCTQTNINIEELTNGTEYSFKVRAVNSAGKSEWSNVMGPVLPCTVPTAPSELEATPNDECVRLTWSAPASNGGSAVTSYDIQQNDDTNNLISFDCTEDDTSLKYVIDELTNGNNYTFKIRAVNAAGKSPWSDEDGPVMPCRVPSKPTNLQAVPGNSNVGLTWSVPEKNGGSEIHRYEIQIQCTSHSILSCTDNRLSVGDLTNGTEYTFHVRAVNAAGCSRWSSSVVDVVPKDDGSVGSFIFAFCFLLFVCVFVFVLVLVFCFLTVGTLFRAPTTLFYLNVDL
jgi:predicted phage tail protein